MPDEMDQGSARVSSLMQRYANIKSTPKIPQPPKAPPTPGVNTPVPTMTTSSTIPPLPAPSGANYFPEELADDIVARPLSSPDFAMDIKPNLMNPNLHPRWIFTDRRRYSQAVAQGYRNCKKQDLKPGFAALSPFEEEGGTKYINGDLILMLIDRRIYLGALKYKHQIAVNMSDAGIARRISAQKAQAEMGGDVSAINAYYEKQGRRPPMQVFDPDNERADANNVGADPQGVMSDPNIASREASRLGGTPDFGKMADLVDKQERGG